MLGRITTRIAIHWIMSRCAGTMGITGGETTFTDQDYADDAVLFTDDPNNWAQILTRFDTDAQTMGLHTSGSKTRLKNAGYGTTPVTTCCSHPRTYR